MGNPLISFNGFWTGLSTFAGVLHVILSNDRYLHEHPRMLDYDYQELINICILCKTTLVSSGKSSTFCDDKHLVFVFVHIIERVENKARFNSGKGLSGS